MQLLQIWSRLKSSVVTFERIQPIPCPARTGVLVAPPIRFCGTNTTAPAPAPRDHRSSVDDFEEMEQKLQTSPTTDNVTALNCFQLAGRGLGTSMKPLPTGTASPPMSDKGQLRLKGLDFIPCAPAP